MAPDIDVGGGSVNVIKICDGCYHQYGDDKSDFYFPVENCTIVP